MKRFLPFLLLTGLAAAQPAAPDPAVAEAARLREALRATTLQLRTVQTDLANAQAARTLAEQKTATVEKEVASLGKQLAERTREASADKAAAEKSIATLNNKVADRDKRLGEFTAALEKWKAAYGNAASIAQAKENERSKLSGEAIALRRLVADREAKNLVLFKTAREILDRYADHALGKAILAREPFIGTSRVKIENQIQGYGDAILDNRIKAPAPTQP